MKRAVIFMILSFLLIGCKEKITYDFVISDVNFFDGEEFYGIVNIGISSDSTITISTDPLQSDSVLNGEGKFLMPGMVNSHVHIWEKQQLKAGYEHGILANIGMHASNESRDSIIRVASFQEEYPYYFTSGFAATVPGGHPTQISYYPIETITDSLSTKTFVKNRKAADADFIKIVREGNSFMGKSPLPTLSYDSIKALINHAHENDMIAVVHIGSLDEMLNVAKFNPDGFAHMWFIRKGVGLTDERLQIIKESGAFVIPTVILDKKGYELIKRGSPEEKWAKKNLLHPNKAKEAIKKMHDAGVMIVAGTDAGARPFINWGDDLLAEMEIYSNAGMTNLEVLRTATGNPAKAFDIPIGLLKEGGPANMILLNDNPINNLNALKKVDRIWKAEI